MLMKDVTDLVELSHKKIMTTNQILMSIGKTAYPVMVQMALEFQQVHSYTGVME